MRKLILFIVVTYFFTSCDENGTKYKLDSNTIEYFATAKNGSWYIFRNTAQFEIDSFYISDYSNTYQYLNDKPKGDSYQIIRYKLNSNKMINFAEVAVNWLNKNDTVNSFDYTSNYSGVETNYFKNFPKIEWINGSFNVASCNNCGSEFISPINIQSLEFLNVLKVWNGADTFYFAPRIGLIKFYVDDNNFEISSYEINY